MEKLLAELLGTAATPLIAALNANTEAKNRNSDLLERVVAGQEAAMAKLEGAPATGRKPRATKPAEPDTPASQPDPKPEPAPATPAETPTPAPEPVSTVHPLLAAPNGETRTVERQGKPTVEPTANYRASDFSLAQVKNEFIGWLGESTDAAVKKERADFIGAAAQHLGVKLPFSPTDGLQTDDQRKQILFFLRRKREGLAVDFNADYDFDADPLADQTLDETDEPDPLG